MKVSCLVVVLYILNRTTMSSNEFQDKLFMNMVRRRWVYGTVTTASYWFSPLKMHSNDVKVESLFPIVIMWIVSGV